MLKADKPDYLECMLKARLVTPSNINWRARMPEITQPTLIIMGEQDKRFMDGAKLMAKTIPNSRLEIIPGAGHMVNLGKPEEFNKVLLDWMDN